MALSPARLTEIHAPPASESNTRVLASQISIDFTMHSNKGEQRMLSHNHAISGIQGRKTFFTSVEKKSSLQQWENLLSFRLDKCENLKCRRIDLIVVKVKIVLIS